MAYTTGFESDLFISFAHQDNTKGWVTEFHSQLQDRFNQLLGKNRPQVVIWRDPKLNPTDLLSPEIRERLSKSAVLLSIITPSCMVSDWCIDERNKFQFFAALNGGYTVGNSVRAVNVIKTPLPNDHHRDLLGSLNVDFYSRDAQSGRFDEFDPSDPRFGQRVNSLAQSLLAFFDKLNYDSLWRVAADPQFVLSKERFQELARGKAERDGELPTWVEIEVTAFEEHHAAPVKVGSDLLRVVMSVLKDIQFRLDKGDVTSRPLLQRAKDEDEVRNWIVEQMNFRARGRFHAYREAQVANKDRPDIIIASTAAPCEVGMEVKHGGKKWTRPQLENAMRVQLANNYLKPASRRHGVFVITNHGLRRWRDADTKQMMDFTKVMAWLASMAIKITTNDSGPIQVTCFGIDASRT